MPKTKEPKLKNPEVNSRQIGGGGEVTWLHQEGEHFIFVFNVTMDVAYVKSTLDGAEAKQIFDHPFAYSDVPNIFASDAPE